MTLGAITEATMPYFTIPVFVRRISSQNGAITTADKRGNDVEEWLENGFLKLIRPFELIYINSKI